MPAKRPMPRNTGIIVALVCLLVSCGVASIVRPGNRSLAAVKAAFPKVQIVRRIPARNSSIAVFSSSGKHFSLINHDGLIDVYTSNGRFVYSGQAPDTDKAIVSADGSYVMAYSERNPTNSSLTFLDSSGNVCWSMNVSGAVWCAEACKTDDGAGFIVGTSDKYVYVVDIGHNSKRYRRLRAPGAVVSVYANDGGITYGTWQRSAICRITERNKQHWRVDAATASLQQLQPLCTLDRVLVCSTPNKFDADGDYSLMDKTGSVILQGKLDASEKASIMAAPNGRYICIASRRLIIHKGKSMPEKHATLVDDSGATLWEKGSPFFQAQPIAVTRAGYVLISDSKGAIFTVSPSGEMKGSIKVPGPVVESVASRDASRVILRCRDGMLYILKII